MEQVERTKAVNPTGRRWKELIMYYWSLGIAVLHIECLNGMCLIELELELEATPSENKDRMHGKYWVDIQ